MASRDDIIRLVAAQNRQEDRIVRLGVAATTTAVTRARAAAIWAYRAGENVLDAARAEIERTQPVLANAMMIGYLQGRLRSTVTADLAKRGLSLADPFRVVREYLENKLNLTPLQIIAITQHFGEESISATGQLMTRLEDFVSKAVMEAFRQNLHVQGGVQLLREAFTAAGVAPQSDHALETMFRTQHNIAYSAGRWQGDQQPAIQEILWGYEYSTVRDNRVRPSHAALDGFRARKDDPIWKTIWPPNGYNCRCTTLQIFKGDAEAFASPPLGPREVDGVLVDPEPDPGFFFNSGEVFDSVAHLVGV